jgi:hypothetical protein
MVHCSDFPTGLTGIATAIMPLAGLGSSAAIESVSRDVGRRRDAPAPTPENYRLRAVSPGPLQENAP